MFAEKKKAFSLVELLVVISVIALLMAILMPALAAARSQARSAVCKSNLRQLAIANIGYAAENDGFYVAAAKDIWNNNGLHRWHGVRESTNEAFEPLRGPLVSYLVNGKVKECPKRIGFAEGFESGCGGYGYNMSYIGSRGWQGGISSLEDYRASFAKTTCTTEVGKPSETLMFVDCAMSMNGRDLIEYSFAEPPYFLNDGEVATDWGLSSPSIHFRHRRRANIVWVDGHVGCREMAESDGENVYGVNSAEMKLGWFKPIDNTLFDLE
jgi:prepilin-type N-terminal cleavage/methylation domain-containing protein/prepilin-type processing-associated H-X9-DG protein